MPKGTQSYKILLLAYRSTALVLFNTAILLVCVEGVAAILAYFSHDEDPRAHLSYYTSRPWSTEFWREHRRAQKPGMRYDPYVVWKGQPFTGSFLNITDEGHRRTPGARCVADSYRVFVFGGSAAWGWGVPDWGTIPAYLQARLSERGVPVCVINFAQNAWVSTQELIALIRLLQAGQVPDLAIFYHGANDAGATYRHGLPGVHYMRDQIAEKLDRKDSQLMYHFRQILRTSHTYSLLRRLVLTRPQQQEPPPPKHVRSNRQALVRQAVRTYHANYKIAETLSREYSFKYGFFWQPTIYVGRKPLTSEERGMLLGDPSRIVFVRDVDNEIAKLAPQLKHLYYLGNVFDDQDTLIWIDNAHVTPDGNKLVAHEILGLLENQH